MKILFLIIISSLFVGCKERGYHDADGNFKLKPIFDTPHLIQGTNTSGWGDQFMITYKEYNQFKTTIDSLKRVIEKLSRGGIITYHDDTGIFYLKSGSRIYYKQITDSTYNCLRMTGNGHIDSMYVSKTIP